MIDKNRYQLKKEFLRDFCNWGKLRSLCITVDIDWAPDYMLDYVASLLENVNPTFFATHDSVKSRELAQVFDFGIHPNITGRSSQGKDIFEVVRFFENLDFVSFECSRFHLLGYSYPDLEALVNAGTKIDSSNCMLNSPYLIPHLQQDLNLIIAPYFWEDGLRLKAKATDEYINWDAKGAKIFDFHPIDIYLNTPNIEFRNRIKALYPSVSMLPKQEADKLINTSEYGTRDVLISLLNYLKKQHFRCYSLSELNQYMRK